MNKNEPQIRFNQFNNSMRTKTFANLSTEIDYGINAPATDYNGKHKYLRITDIDDRSHGLKNENLTTPNIDLNNIGKYKLTTSDILFTRTGASVGKTYRYREFDGNVYFAGYLIRLRLKSKYDQEFVFQSTLTSRFEKYVEDNSQRSGQPGLNATEIGNYKINIPGYKEQTQIGIFFKELDELIELQQATIYNLEEMKEGFISKLYPMNHQKKPNINVSSQSGEWTMNTFGKIAVRNTKKNKGQKIDNVDSISNKHGFISQKDYFENGELASINTENYSIIEKGVFGYNPSRINVGSIGYKNNNDVSIISPLYVTFKIKDKILDDFIWYWFKTSQFDHQRRILSAGGVRDILSYNSLCEMKIKIPNKYIQTRISVFLRQLDELIELENKELELLQEMKKGFLQKMFV